MPIDKRPSHEIARERVNMLAHELGLDLKAAFVPFSQSRNAKPRAGAAQPWQSLNWKVTIERNGRPVLETDYSQGVGHCPASKAPASRFDKWQRARAIGHEIETGRIAKAGFGSTIYAGKPLPPPEIADILQSLALDSDVLDFPNFAQWADHFGYSEDSRSAESTYRDCLAHALALRSAIGDSALAKLRDAAGEM